MTNMGWLYVFWGVWFYVAVGGFFGGFFYVWFDLRTTQNHLENWWSAFGTVVLWPIVCPAFFMWLYGQKLASKFFKENA